MNYIAQIAGAALISFPILFLEKINERISDAENDRRARRLYWVAFELLICAFCFVGSMSLFSAVTRQGWIPASEVPYYLPEFIGALLASFACALLAQYFVKNLSGPKSLGRGLLSAATFAVVLWIGVSVLIVIYESFHP